MHVLDHEPHVWFLLESDGDLVLDVNCCHSFISYSFAIVLSETERDRFAADGREYIDRLAHEINYSAPIVAESHSAFASRNVHDRYADQVAEAIAEWRRSYPSC